MSLIMHCQCFENGGPSTFDREIAWRIFGPHRQNYPTFDALIYDGVYEGDLYIDDTPRIDGVSVGRPGDSALRDLHKIALIVPSLLYHVDCLMVAREEYFAGFPSWLLEGWDRPVPVVSTADEMLEEMSKPYIRDL